jgi:hypothetical protein
MPWQHKLKNRTTATIAAAALVAVTAVGVGIAVSDSGAPALAPHPTFIAFDHNTILGADATVFDIEADAIGGYETDISITDNTVVGFHYAYLLSAQTGAQIDRLAFIGNRMTEGAQMRVVIVDKLAGSNVRISHNTASASDTASDYRQPAIRILGVSDVEVDDNTIPVGKGGLAVLSPGALLCNGDACPIHSPVASPIAPEWPS